MIEVNEENIRDYSIDDVLFPIVGHKVGLPSNAEMRKITEDVMAEDGISEQKYKD